nr:nuclear transport factor 2 family protein [Sciscionella marina]
MEDAVARFRAASVANDIDGMVATLSSDAELVSPLSGRMVFRGAEDLRVLLAAIYGRLSRLQWHAELGDGELRVVVGQARIGALRLDDAMVLRLAADGRIRSITPHLRPWLAVTLLALRVAPAVVRHPVIVRRALRRP